jgi:hypothetical protein
MRIETLYPLYPIEEHISRFSTLALMIVPFARRFRSAGRGFWYLAFRYRGEGEGEGEGRGFLVVVEAQRVVEREERQD